jgi:hypothetical protein
MHCWTITDTDATYARVEALGWRVFLLPDGFSE